MPRGYADDRDFAEQRARPRGLRPGAANGPVTSATT